MTFLEEAIKPAALKSAWNRVSRGKLHKASASRAGSDGQSLASVALHLDDTIGSISDRLRRGKFKFSNLDPHFVPKKDGKPRVICSPIVADRIVQRSILDVAGKHQAWLLNPVSYGFVYERSVEKAAKKATEYRAKNPWVFKTDITKFFDCIDRVELRKKVVKQVRQKSLHSLILSAIDCEIATVDESTAVKIKKQGIRTGVGVRQGMPLSPFFANLYLAKFDRACVDRGLSVLRYADDLIFFAESEQQARDLSEFCETELQKIGLSIPMISSEGKSQIHPPDEAAGFLGVELAPAAAGAYVVAISQKQLDFIKSSIYEISSLAGLRQRNLDMARFGSSLAARCAAYAAVYEYCANSALLNTCLSDWQAAVKAKIAIELGIDISKLSKNGRWFLGLP